MKWLYSVCLVLIFASCQLPNNDLGMVVRDGIRAGIEAADRNKDGVVSSQEIKDSRSDPNFWIAIGGALLGLLGLNGAKRAQRDADELYDKVVGGPQA